MPDDSKNKLYPLLGYDILSYRQSMLMLAVRTAKNDAQLKAAIADRSAADLINLGLSPVQALELAKDLTKYANQILSQATPKRSDQH